MGRILRLANQISDRSRRRKFQFFMDTFSPAPDTRVLDVGAETTEYQLNSNIIEKQYPYPEQLTALGVGDFTEFEKRYPQVRALSYDGRIFPFDDGSFDICWSNAVIEHVGDREAQVVFMREIARCAKRAYVTTPNRHFPVEVHTKVPLLHFLPKPMFDRILKAIGRGWAAGEYMDLLTLSDVEYVLREAGIEDYQIVKNRIFGLTATFSIIFPPS